MWAVLVYLEGISFERSYFASQIVGIVAIC